MGGDGTVLYAHAFIEAQDIPVLGINLGNLGFLTAVSEKELPMALDYINNGQYQLREREGALIRYDKGNGKLS